MESRINMSGWGSCHYLFGSFNFRCWQLSPRHQARLSAGIKLDPRKHKPNFLSFVCVCVCVSGCRLKSPPSLHVCRSSWREPSPPFSSLWPTTISMWGLMKQKRLCVCERVCVSLCVCIWFKNTVWNKKVSSWGKAEVKAALTCVRFC